MSRSFNVNRIKNLEPKRCWVGEMHKICYSSREEAEVAARVAEFEHKIPGGLDVYKCEYEEHWHLKSK